MKVETILPSAALAPFIKQFIILESDSDFCSKTIPDTFLVMTFRYRGNVSRMVGEKKETISCTSFSGLRRSGCDFYYTKGTANLLVLFHEGGIHAFSRIPAHELFGLSVNSENLFRSGELNEVIERLAEARNNSARIIVLEAFFLKKLVHEKSDPRIDDATRSIKQHHGVIRIKELANSLSISQDAFEKRFRTLVGTTPKQYASIVRLRSLIRNYPSYASLTEASYEAGYFDQSHFIKDFRLFTGQTPKDFFKTDSYW
jgi:AraC-like DNA-binding protein